MRRRFTNRLPWLVGTAIAVAAAPAIAQVFVYPQRPSQSHVRYEQFDWQWVDIRRAEGARGEPTWQTGPRLHNLGIGAATGPGGWTLGPVATAGSTYDQIAGSRASGSPRAGSGSPAPSAELAEGGAIPGAAARAEPPDPPESEFVEGGGVRLYYYDRERDVAERAAASISDGYDYLARAFDFVPPRTFPYFLYSSYQDFLQTNLFPVQEGVLGVTATQGSLEMTLPYFGDHQMFDHVSVHELAHQFTIQKVRSRAREMDAHGDPLSRIPLWFVEGIAEFYSRRELDAETKMLLRDLALHPAPRDGYALRDFFDDRARGYLWTYKLGQARVTFLDETYGEETLQKILYQSPRLVALPDAEQRVGGFPALVARITGDTPPVIHRKFESWLKEAAYDVFLEAPNRPEDLDSLGEGRGLEAQAMTASPDGTVVMYRTLHRDTRRSEIRLVDPRQPGDTVRVARDGVPGIESLHPIAGRNLAVGDASLAFVARRRGRDVIYWQDYDRTAERSTETVTPDASSSTLSQMRLDREMRRRGMAIERERWDVSFDLGDREAFAVTEPDVTAVDKLAMDPDGGRVAFIGLARSGQKDLFVLHRESGEVQQLTDDMFAERGLAWGDQGIVYSSDATEHGYFNLFRIPEVGAASERLTSELRDHAEPVALPGGRTMFVAYDDMGANLYEVVDGEAVQRSGVATGVFSPAPAPRGVWTLYHYQGRRRIARLPSDRMVEAEPRPRVANHGLPEPLSTLSLTGSSEYDAWDLDSWSLGPIFGVFGASSEGLYGQGIAVATDRLRDHTLALQVQAYGSYELIDGDLFYTNARHRMLWGGGLFQDVSFRIDRTFEDEEDGFLFYSAERFSGARTLARYALDQYRFVQAGLAGGVVGRFLTPTTREILEAPDDPRNPTGRDVTAEWDEQHDGLALRGEASLGFGYNTLRFHPATGPIAGGSALLSGTFATEPGGIGNFTRTRLDGEYYIPIRGASNIAFRGGVGQIFGSDEARNFFLSSLDTLRSVPFGNTNVLLGRSFGFSTLELRVPLNPIVQIAFIDVEAIAGGDFGGVGDSPEEVWDNRILNGVTGLNFGIGWIVFRLHFARPFDIGGIVPNNGDWNVNFSLGYRYM